MVSSNSCQPMVLFYCKNIVTQSHVVIFVNTKCKDLSYKDAMLRGEQAKDLFIEILEFDDFDIRENLSKAEIIKVLDDIERIATEF